MKNIAIFGGSFNPIHNGHINLIRELNKKLSFDEIIFIPSKIPPHKSADRMISGEHRINMVKLAINDIKTPCTVSDIEITSEGVSYSVYTLRRLKEIYPQDKLWFIMGSDMLNSLDKWYKTDEILKLCSVAAAARNNGEYESLLRKSQLLCEIYPYSEIKVLNIDVIQVSSSQIREKIKDNMDVSDYLNEKVYNYIIKNNLYQ